MVNRQWFSVLVLAVTVSLLSCCGCEEPPPSAIPPAIPPAKPPPTPGSPSSIHVRIGDEKDLAALVRRYKGRVVLVDYWATWCKPCTQLFPHSVELSRAFSDSGLAVISVSMNEPEEEKQVLSFLRANGANFNNLLSRFGYGSEAVEKFDLPGELPHYKLFDRSGRLRHELSGEPDKPLKPRIDAAVRELLTEK